MPRVPSINRQLELGRGPLLLDDVGRGQAIEHVQAADARTRSRWVEQARVIVSALNAGWIERSKEVALHSDFLTAVFGELLGYRGALSGRMPFTMSAAVTTEVDATEADATLGWFTAPGQGQTRVVIELKDARTSLDKRQLSRRDRLTPVDQAFLYANKFAGCRWVIVCNFLELRLYSVRHGQTLYETLWLRELDDEASLVQFLALLLPEALIGDQPEAPGHLASLLVDRPVLRQRRITEDFYAGYADRRGRLIHHLVQSYPDESPHALIAAAQKLLDRLLFIAFAEDRPLLPSRLLNETAEIARRSRSRSPSKIWDELVALFRDIDVGRDDVLPAIPAYNGGLFATDPLLDERVALPDDLVADLITLGDYDYRRTIDVEILGHVFEQSISDLELLRAAHSLDPHAVETDAVGMVEARRALGVFYTPRWVTEYIVNATVGEIATRGETDPERLAHLTILDPACGSGAFLAQAFRYLLELASASLPDVLPDEQGSLLEQTGVVQPSMYLAALHGVDVMPEAVEIARLSLWLASASPLERLRRLDGVAVGNTLATLEGAGLLPTLFTAELEAGGFDAVIGNPPWGARLDFDLDPSLLLARGQFDSYELFVERAMRDALRDGGLLGFVIPDRFLRPEGQRLRRWLFDNYQVLEVIKLGEGVFAHVFRAAVILIVRKAPPGDHDRVRTLSVSKDDRAVLEETGATYLHALLEERSGHISRSRIVADPVYAISLGATDEDLEIMETMREGSRPWTDANGLFAPHGRGVELGADGFVIRCNACSTWQVGPRRRSQARGGGYATKTCSACGVTMQDGEWAQSASIIVRDRPAPGGAEDRRLPGEGWAPLYLGEDVARYELLRPRWIRLAVPGINYKEPQLYRGPKLLIRQAGVGVNAAVDAGDAYCLQSVYVYRVREGVEADAHFFLGCLVSRAMLFFYHRLTNQTEWQSFPKLVHTTLHDLPLPDPATVETALHERVSTAVRARMGMPAEEAHELDLEIEQLVMEAYGLAPAQRQRITRTLRSVQRLRVIREMFPLDGDTPQLQV